VGLKVGVEGHNPLPSTTALIHPQHGAVHRITLLPIELEKILSSVLLPMLALGQLSC